MKVSQKILFFTNKPQCASPKYHSIKLTNNRYLIIAFRAFTLQPKISNSNPPPKKIVADLLQMYFVIASLKMNIIPSLIRLRPDSAKPTVHAEDSCFHFSFFYTSSEGILSLLMAP